MTNYLRDSESKFVNIEPRFGFIGVSNTFSPQLTGVENEVTSSLNGYLRTSLLNLHMHKSGSHDSDNNCGPIS